MPHVDLIATRNRVLYPAYRAHRYASAPSRAACRLTAGTVGVLPGPVRRLRPLRSVSAACEIIVKAHPTHKRPEFGIETVAIDGEQVPVVEEVEPYSPFASLIHFTKPSLRAKQQAVLVVGPMSGHFSTLIRNTIRSLLADHDVYVLDWHNARDIPLEHGRFDLDDFIEHVMDGIRRVGPQSHVLAVCQPSPAVMAAVGIMAAEQDPCQPASMTLIAGPVDTRVDANRIGRMASQRSLKVFARAVIATVPAPYPGAGRRVYPGFLQLAAFMSLHPTRHLRAHGSLYKALVRGQVEKAATIQSFYDEYGAVMDVPAEFYLDTILKVFQRHDLARNAFQWRGRHVDLRQIQNTALLTVEGANDDMCPPGQTAAAHALCSGIPEERKRHFLAEGVGHYGVFSGSTWENKIYPTIRDFIAETSRPKRARAKR